LASGSTARFTALAALGCLLGVPAIVRPCGHSQRWASWLVLAFGAASAALNAALTIPVFLAARTLGQPIALGESLFGATPDRSIEPRVVTFAAGDGWQLEADVYRPPAPAPGALPAVIVVHGGAWRGGDKGENVVWNEWLATVHGYVVLDIQYRLAPAANSQQQVVDIRSSVTWLRSHAAELDVDPERIALLGRSAGGHLALLAAYAWRDADGPAPAAVVALYAPTELAELFSQSPMELREALSQVQGGPPSAVPDVYHQASPVHLVRRGLPPTLLIHGTWDDVVPVAQSEQLAGALEQMGSPVQLVRLPFARHAFDMVLESPASQLARGALATFLGQTLLHDAVRR
jgi:acetyl esterase/lipase